MNTNKETVNKIKCKVVEKLYDTVLPVAVGLGIIFGLYFIYRLLWILMH